MVRMAAMPELESDRVELPPAPLSVEETGLDSGLLVDLALKTVYFAGNPLGAEVAERMALPLTVAQEILGFLRHEHLCEVTGGSGTSSASFRHALTGEGALRANQALEFNGYVGPAPVPLADYIQQVEHQSVHREVLTRGDIEASLAHLVFSADTLERLGRAVSSGKATLLFGPSGNGKSDIVTSIARMVAGTVVIPYALFGHSQLIRVFDPDVHKSQVDDVTKSEGVWADTALRHDRRWLPVNRPTVIIGGDMGGEALEMTYDATQGVHNAPLSIVAQGGVLVIDDLGRQKIAPKEILNRWVIMMEQGYDSFALSSSEIVRLPLDVTLVFSTNLTVQDLMDEAYLRRIAYKIAIPNPDRDQLAEISRRFCNQKGLAWSEDTIQYLVERMFAPGLPPPRCCYPRDLVTTVIDEAEFHGREPVLDRESIDTACSLYLGSDSLEAA